MSDSAGDVAEATKSLGAVRRDVGGRFLAGHNVGRPPKYTVAAMTAAVSEYLDACVADDVPAVWSGLAVHLGMSRQALDSYRNGEKGERFLGVFGVVQSVFEAQAERILLDGSRSVSGAVFWLKNRAGWRDERHIESHSTQDTRLRVTLDADLAARLDDDASVIEGESTDVTPVDSRLA